MLDVRVNRHKNKSLKTSGTRADYIIKTVVTGIAPPKVDQIFREKKYNEFTNRNPIR